MPLNQAHRPTDLRNPYNGLDLVVYLWFVFNDLVLMCYVLNLPINFFWWNVGGIKDIFISPCEFTIDSNMSRNVIANSNIIMKVGVGIDVCLVCNVC